MPSLRKRLVPLCLGLALLVGGTSAHADPERAAPSVNFDTYVPGAAELEGRIIAPCCWTQTIDIHGSEIATALRQEIRTRLSAGESPEAIEASLVNRYGTRILAVPPGSRLGSAGGVLALSLLAAGIGAVVLLRRWQKRGHAPSLPPAPPSSRPGARNPNEAALDAQIDQELARLDGD